MTINLFDLNYYRAFYPDLGAAGFTTDAQEKNFNLNILGVFAINKTLSLLKGKRSLSLPFINSGFYYDPVKVSY